MWGLWLSSKGAHSSPAAGVNIGCFKASGKQAHIPIADRPRQKYSRYRGRQKDRWTDGQTQTLDRWADSYTDRHWIGRQRQTGRHRDRQTGRQTKTGRYTDRQRDRQIQADIERD